MERKLAEWRARQRVEILQSDSRSGLLAALWQRLRPRGEQAESPERLQDTAEGKGQKENVQTSFPQRSLEEPVESDHSISWIMIILKLLLWLVLLGLFIELEFGLVYFVLSMFYWIYVGTRDPGRKKQGEISAYSVFNPGCKAIEGTLTAEQFERELQYKPLAGR